ncbi:MAG: ABC transporter substrate-binding protein [Clostridia bacterium]|nr:ABC transporter substrate-binding protein [Clostridia bacterium]
MKRLTIWVACMLTLAGCTLAPGTAEPEDSELIVVGFSQVGAESEWRVANTESMRAALCEANGYELIYDDARQEQENQIRAIRSFIQQDVDYIVLSPITESGWSSILQEAKSADIPVILVDRCIEVADESLYTAYIGSDFSKEGEMAVQWLDAQLERQGRTKEPLNIVHIQGTLGSSAQIGRSGALENAVRSHANWRLIAQEDGDFTRAKAYEVMTDIVKKDAQIDVVYCENDGEALGAIDALEQAGYKCNVWDGVIVVAFDATNLGLNYCLDGRISLNVECNPLQGPYVADIISALEQGAPIEKVQHIDETLFDCFTITQQIIDARAY